MRRFLPLLILALAACHVSVAQTYSETTFYSFGPPYDPPFTGSFLPGNLIQASDGNLYGTTLLGGAYYDGSIFKVTRDGAVHDLYDAGSGINVPSPFAIIEAGDGNFYGLSVPEVGQVLYGFFPGAVFKMTPSGDVTIVYNFCSQGGNACTDGATPVSLILGSDGNLYGTTMGLNPDFSGSLNAGGTIFKLTLSGTLTTLYSFCTIESNNLPYCPQANHASTIVEASDGNFYGAAVSNNGLPGLLYEMTASGELQTLYTFCSQGGSACTDGTQPNALIQASPDALYGTTQTGGATGNGVAFQLSHAGGYQKLHDFCSEGGTSCTDGGTPAGFFQATDGNLYDVTSYGGFLNSGGGSNGTVGYLTTSGAQTPVFDFCLTNCTDGALPNTPPIQASDGNFYGTTQQGGVNFTGVIYRLAVSPSLPAPVQITVTPAAIAKGASATLQWRVPNAWSMTQQQCYAFINPGIPGDASYGGDWTGKQAGTLANGVLSGSTTITPTGAGTFTYALTCGGNISGLAKLTVEGDASATSFSLSPTTLFVGQSITATVAVTGDGVTPTGTVTLYDGDTVLDTLTLDGSGMATYTTSTGQYRAGSYNITAKYSGDPVYNASKSSPVAVTLEPLYATTNVLTASPLTIQPPASCTFTATVTRKFIEGYGHNPVLLGTSILNGSGVATLTLSSQGVQASGYQITAIYSGDAADTASTSNPVNVTVR
jgi:uncharacterized repeat protein (TIGR03803 family)